MHAAVLRGVRDGLAAAGLFLLDVMPSPLRGADGNVEFLVRADKHGPNAVSEPYTSRGLSADIVS